MIDAAKARHEASVCRVRDAIATREQEAAAVAWWAVYERDAAALPSCAFIHEDDLSVLGYTIGRTLRAKLRALGITNVEQVASLSREAMVLLDKAANTKGRLAFADWPAKAAAHMSTAKHKE